jgi:hypothetical protein
MVPMPITKREKTPKVTLTAEPIAYERAVEAACKDGKCMATLRVVFDTDFMELLKKSDVLVHWEGAPVKMGWYHIDRENRIIEPVSEEKVGGLGWYDRIYVYADAVQAVREARPLILDFCGDHVNGYALFLNGDYGAGHTTRAVQGGLDHEAAPIRAEVKGVELRQGVSSHESPQTVEHNL